MKIWISFIHLINIYLAPIVYQALFYILYYSTVSFMYIHKSMNQIDASNILGYNVVPTHLFSSFTCCWFFYISQSQQHNDNQSRYQKDI